MTLLTLTATTRRVASAKGNYSKEDAISGKQYPLGNTEMKKTVSEPSAEIKRLQATMNSAIKGWYKSGGKILLPLGDDSKHWDTIINLVEKLYDPVFAGGHLPSTLCDSSSLGAAIFASLATVIEEKLSVLCGEGGVLRRSKNNVALTDTLLSNGTLSNIFMTRIKKMARVKEINANDAKEREMLLYRMSKLKQAPLPHQLSLFEKFGDGTRNEETSSSASAVAGTTIASDMHCKLVNHVFKVAFRNSGPGRRHLQQSLVETHALSKYVVEKLNGRDDLHDPDRASIFYCDYNDFEAYQALPDKFKMSSIVPGSHNMEDLPFRPFAVPAHYKTSERSRLFKYERAVPLRNSRVCFDYGEFLCYCIFGVEWDKHLGDTVDALGHSCMENFNPGVYSGVFKDTRDFNRLGSIRMGVADFALRSVAEFIRSEAYDAAKNEKEEENEDSVLSTLRNAIRSSVHQIRSFLTEDLPAVVLQFKQDLPAGDYGKKGEFECLTAHLFLSRLSDECHVLRNMDIERTVFSTRISLMRRNKIASRGVNVQTYSSMEEIPEGVLAGLSGEDVADEHFRFGGTGKVVVSWDGFAGKVIGVWRDNAVVSTGHYISIHESVANKHKDDLRMVQKIKNILREASETGHLNPIFFNREALYRALREKGIFVPGTNLTETGRSFEGLRNLEIEEESDGKIGEVAVSGLREDKLENKTLMTEAFWRVREGIKTLAQTATTAEKVPMKIILESFRTDDATLGFNFLEQTQPVVERNTKQNLLEETEALRANKIAFSSIVRDLGVRVNKELDAEFAAEMRETYPDTAIREFEESQTDIEKIIPKSQIREIENVIGRETEGNLEELEQKINDMELSTIIESVLNMKLGNGVSVFVGRFATASMLVGTVVVAGFLGPALLGSMHASRGTHLNVVNHINKNGMISYKVTDWAKKNIIGKESGSWMNRLPKGQSLTRDKGMTAMQALLDILKSLGGDHISAIVRPLDDKVVTEGVFINSTALIVGTPIAASIAATKLQLCNWKIGLVVGLSVLLLMLIVRFFVGSGAFTLKWFTVNVKAKRSYTEAYGINKEETRRGRRGGVEEYIERNRDNVKRVNTMLRPAFLPATTNYSRAAKVIGVDVTLFTDCYRCVIQHYCGVKT